MNYKKAIIILSMFGLFVCPLNGQSKGNKRVNSSYGNWSFGAGINIVDDSGSKGKDFFNIEENWNYSSPYTVSVEYYINNQWSLSVAGSMNDYVSDKNIDSIGLVVKGFTADYFAVDLATRFYLGDLFSSYTFDTYMFLGVGYNKIGRYKIDPFIVDLPIDIDTLPNEINGIPVDVNGFYDMPAVGKITLNGGVGFNYWFAEKWGLNFNFSGKVAIRSDEPKTGPNSVSNHAQFSLGVIYFLNNK
jgi:hypothetical protein